MLQRDPVANVNDVPVGAPIISSNTPTVGVSLTVGLGSIVDDDGEPPPLGVQWLRGNTNPYPGGDEHDVRAHRRRRRPDVASQGQLHRPARYG